MSKAAPAAHRIYPAYCFSAAPTFQKWVKLTAADVQALRQEPGFDGQNIFFHLNHPIEFVYLIGPVVAVDHFVTRYNTRFTVLEIDDGSGATIEVKINYKSQPRASNRPTATVAATTDAADGHDRSDDSSSDQDPDSNNTNPLHNTTAPTAPPLLTTRIFETTVANLTVKAGPHGTDLLLAGHPIDIGAILKVKGTLTRWRNAYQLILRRAFAVPSIDDEAAAWRDYAHFATTVLARPWVLSDERLAALEQAAHDAEAAQRRRAERKRERERDRAARRALWERRRERYERHAERKRQREARELDGNALDRPGWKPLRAPVSAPTVRLGPAERDNDSCVEQPQRQRHEVNPLINEPDAAIVPRRELGAITTAKALWQHEQQQQVAYPAGPARWQHEYAAGAARDSKQREKAGPHG